MASNVRVSSTIKLNEAKLKELTKQQYESLAQTADALLTDLRDSGTMPFDTGNLQNDSTFLEDSQKAQGRVSIVSSTPYARRLYYHPEYNFAEKGDSESGGTGRGAYWADRYMQNGGRDEIEQAARKAVKE